MPRCLPTLISFCRSIWDRFLIQTSIPRTIKNVVLFCFFVFLQKIVFASGIDFGANLPPFSLTPNIQQHRIKDRSWTASLFWSMFASICCRFGIDVWSHLGVMLDASWSPKRCSWQMLPPFCWIYVFFWFVGHPGFLLVPIWLSFVRFAAPFWKFSGAILPSMCDLRWHPVLLRLKS